EHVHRSEYRVQAGVRERSSGMHDRRRSAAHGVGERLVAEYAREPAAASPAFVRLDVTLIPGNAKRRFGELKHEDGEGSVGGKALPDTSMFWLGPFGLIRTVALALGRHPFAPPE